MMLQPPVPPGLRPFVLRVTGFEERQAEPVRRRELPLVGTPIIMSFGSPYRLSTHDDPGLPVVTIPQFVAGLHETYTTSESTGTNWSIQVDLSPIGAYRILQQPLRELTNRIERMEDVLGPSSAQLRSDLEATATWSERFRLVDAFLSSRLDHAASEEPGIAWAWRQLVTSQGVIAIQTLTDELDWSHRLLIDRFREQIGLPPKVIARQLRFQSAAQRLRTQPERSLAEIADAAGYFDQAHFSREFRKFAGITPGDFRHSSAFAGSSRTD